MLSILHALLTYNTDLFDAATITRLREQFQQLLERVAANPELRLGDWPRLQPAIDLAAVEMALREDASVSDCAVLERKTQSGGRQWVAYVIPATAFTPEKWRARLQSMLPAYQVPRAFVRLARMPLTPAGTVDETALSQLEVIDEPLLKAWEAQLQSVPGVEQVAVIVREKVVTEWPLHIADLLPDFKTAKKDSTALVPHHGEQKADSKQARPLAVVEATTLEWETDAPVVLADLLRRAATQSDKGVIYLEADGVEVKQSYRELLQDAQRVLAGLRDRKSVV